ncbi:MAG: Mu transposase C-terminal domain-containing protein, partial [Microvirgula sp.]
LTELHGEPVQVAYDIHEAERVWVYLKDGRFVCHAEWNANRTAYFARPVIEQKRAARAEAALRRLDERRDAVEAERDGRAALAAVATPTLPGLAGHDIAGAFERLDAVDVAAVAETVPRRPAAAPAGDDFSVPPTPALRYHAWLALDARTASGVLLTPREARWLASYARSHEFNVMKQTGACDATA